MQYKARVDYTKFANYKDALAEAKKLAAEKNGKVCSFPDLVDIKLAKRLEHPIWDSFQSTISEQIATCTRQGNPVLLTIHSMGPLAEYLINGGAVDKKEWRVAFGVPLPRNAVLKALDGRLSDGSNIPIYSFDEYAKNPKVLGPHGIVMDEEQALFTPEKKDFLKEIGKDFDKIPDTPRNLAMVGGLERAKSLKKRFRNSLYEIISHLQPKDFKMNVGRQLHFTTDYEFPNRRLINDSISNLYLRSYAIVSIELMTDPTRN